MWRWLALGREVARQTAPSTALSTPVQVNYRELLANLPHMSVFAVDTDLRFVLAEGAGRLTGVDDDLAGAELLGRTVHEVLAPEIWAIAEPHYLSALAGEVSEFETPGVQSGEVIGVRTVPLPGADGTVAGVLAITEQVTAQHQALAALHAAQEFNEAVLAASPDLMVVLDLVTGEWLWASASVWASLGWTGAALDADPTEVMRHVMDEDVAVVDDARAELLHMPSGESVTFRFRLAGPDGAVRWISCRATPFTRGETDAGALALAAVRDDTDLVEAEVQLQYAARHDALTGLPNHACLLELIEEAIARQSDGVSDLAMLYCDLDGFKNINDTYGHEAGDAVLVEVARRLASVLREQDFVGRVGGDEFVVVLQPSGHRPESGPPDPTGSSTATVRSIAERIAREVARPILHAGLELQVTLSIGTVSIHPGSTPAGVLRDADSAMYRAKERGRGRVEAFDEALRSTRAARLYIEAALTDALASPPVGLARLSACYQPIFDLAPVRLTSFEALARLTSRDGSTISPDEFIPIAEKVGLIHLLDERVLDMALSTLHTWEVEHPDANPIRMAVNVSASRVQEVDLCALIRRALAKHEVAPSSLVIEVTESVLVRLNSTTLRQLDELHELGVRIAIDDFGTGYASLDYLTTLPVDVVKIDRCFTQGLGTDRRKTTIVQAVAALAYELELVCIVEGIETEEQLAVVPLGALGQGYLLGQPHAVPQDGYRADESVTHPA